MNDNNIIINQQVSLPYPFGAHKAFPLDSRSFFSNMEEAQAAVHDAVQLQRNQNGDFILPSEEDGGADSIYYYGEPISVAENNAETVGLYIITKAFDEHDEPYGVLQNVCSGLSSEYLRRDEANDLINSLIQGYIENNLNTDCIDDYLFTNAIDDCDNVLPTDGLYAYGLKETNGVLEKCENTKKVLSFDPQTPYNKNTNPLATLETVNNKAKELKEYVDEHSGAGMLSILYSGLVEKRDNSQLVPGTWYRITDYACTTTQQDTMSANHAFDIIVRADDESHLNENAFAAHHEGDEYFANCKLEAWELKYSLDNGTNRFAWADDENGTGVVFYMKDEWGNIAPFDFKNMLFTRDSEWFGDHETWAGDVLGEVPETDLHFYFLSWVTEDGEVQDASIAGQTLTNDEGAYTGVYDNEIKETTAYYMGITEDATSTAFVLPCTIIVSSYAYEDGVFYGCYGNKFGNNCQYNSFGNYCNSNSFGKNCYGNTFGNNCYDNTFGNDCWDNSFGNNCQCNSFGDSCYYNSFGKICNSNSFGNGCGANSFGNICGANSFGNDFQNNSFGNYCQTITVFDGVQNCSVTGGSQSAPVKNAQILNGTAGASAQNKLTIAFAANKVYTQVAGLDSNGNIRIWNPADPVTLPSNLTYIG